MAEAEAERVSSMSDPLTARPLPVNRPPPPSMVPSLDIGRLASMSNRHGNPELRVLNLTRGQLKLLTSNNAADWLPDSSPGRDELSPQPAACPCLYRQSVLRTEMEGTVTQTTEMLRLGEDRRT